MATLWSPNLPEAVDSTKMIPRQDVAVGNLRNLYVMDTWSGVGYVRALYRILMMVNTAFWIYVFIYYLVEATVGSILFSLVVVPLLFYIYSIFTRIVCEIVVSILLLPVSASSGQCDSYHDRNA